MLAAFRTYRSERRGAFMYKNADIDIVHLFWYSALV